MYNAYFNWILIPNTPMWYSIILSTYPSFVNCRLRPIHPHGRGFIQIFSSCIWNRLDTMVIQSCCHAWIDQSPLIFCKRVVAASHVIQTILNERTIYPSQCPVLICSPICGTTTQPILYLKYIFIILWSTV